MTKQSKPEQQPTRLGKHREERRFDQTQLHANSSGRAVGRDYAAHFFRWAWIVRQIKAGQKILDLGCGQDVPLVRVLTPKVSQLPKLYVGVDLNRIPKPTQIAWTRIVDSFNFVDDYLKLWKRTGMAKDEKFDCACALEIIEHMQPADGKKLLKGAFHLVRPGGYLYLSTPVFSGVAARNHCHEFTIPELQKLIESTGWIVERRFGTFARINDIKKVAKPEEWATLQKIGEFYNNEVLSVFLAPLYPDSSSNNLWVLRRP